MTCSWCTGLLLRFVDAHQPQGLGQWLSPLTALKNHREALKTPGAWTVPQTHCSWLLNNTGVIPKGPLITGLVFNKYIGKVFWRVTTI